MDPGGNRPEAGGFEFGDREDFKQATEKKVQLVNYVPPPRDCGLSYRVFPSTIIRWELRAQRKRRKKSPRRHPPEKTLISTTSGPQRHTLQKSLASPSSGVRFLQAKTSADKRFTPLFATTPKGGRQDLRNWGSAVTGAYEEN